MIALILVDIQNDFLPGGALAVPRGDEILPLANRLIQNYQLVVATQDWHPANHQSFASQHPERAVGDTVTVDGLEQILWPDHCIQGTPGAEFAAKLNLDRVHHFIRKGTDPMIDSYSGFFDNAHRKSTGLEPLLKTAGVKEVHVMGLALDYCVQFTALDALQLGFHTRVLLDGSRGVDLHPGDCDQAIQRMRERGIIVA